MYYEINVSCDGKHFFATSERSLTTRIDAQIAYNIFKDKFPADEGYKISVSRIEQLGYDQTKSFQEGC